MSRSKGHYAAALNAPFSEEALGAQIPDIFSYPTETKHFRQSFLITSDKNGNGEFILMPSPLFSVTAPLQDVNGTAPEGQGTASSDIITQGFIVSPGLPNGFAGSDIQGPGAGDINTMSIHACTTSTVMAQVFSQYRVVGWGYKIRAIGSLSTTQGRLQVATIPAPRQLPNMNLFSSANSFWPQYDAYALMFGVTGGQGSRASFATAFQLPSAQDTYLNGFSGRLLDYPITTEVTAVALQNVPLRGHGKLHTREFETFRETQRVVGPEVYDDAEHATIVTAFEYRDANGNATPIPLNNTSALQNDTFGPNSMCGWNQVLVSMQGFVPKSTVLEVELIYHVEGIETIATGNDASVGFNIALPMGGRVGPHDPILAMAAQKINALSGESWIYS